MKFLFLHNNYICVNFRIYQAIKYKEVHISIYVYINTIDAIA